MEIVACFRVGVVCAGCLTRFNTNLAVPAGDDAPTTVDELVESGSLERMPFRCDRCEGTIASIASVRRTHLSDQAAA